MLQLGLKPCKADLCAWLREVKNDMIYIKTQVFMLLRYYSPAPRNIARSDRVTQRHHTQDDIIINIAQWAPFPLIMLHS